MVIQKVAIFGAGGHGRVAADIFEQSGFRVIGMFDDDKAKIGELSGKWSILGTFDQFRGLLKNKQIFYFVAIGDNTTRENITERISSIVKRNPCNCISEKAIVSNNIKLGKGILISPGAVINVGVSIGDGVIVNTSASIDHDCQLGNFSSVQPGAILGGSVIVGKRAMVGLGAVVRQNIVIGNDAIIGGGAMVVKNVKEKTIVMGIPAKVAII